MTSDLTPQNREVPMSSSAKNRMNREMLEYLITQATGILSEEQVAKFKADLIKVAMDATSDAEVSVTYVNRLFKEVTPRVFAQQQAALRLEHTRNKRRIKPRTLTERRVRIQKAESQAPMNGFRNHDHANGHLHSGHSIFHESGLE